MDLAWCTSLVNVGGLLDEHPVEDLSPDVLAPVWRQRPRKWTSLIKKAFHRGKLQEAIAHEVRGWHNTIVADLQEAGGTFNGVPGKPPDGTHRCHCGKLCKSAQGLSVHKMHVHGERAPESKYLESPLCPVCMKWFWTVHRLRMHLSYVPRNGKVNKCFYELSRSTLGQQDPGGNERYAIPSSLQGMRLDAISVEGPQKPLLRAVDSDLHQVEEDLNNVTAKLAVYPDPEDVDLTLVETMSRRFTMCTTALLQDGGQPDDLVVGWSKCMQCLCDEYDEHVVEVLFVEWGQNILPEIAVLADEAFGGAVADEAFYDLAKDLDYFDLVAHRDLLFSRRRHLSAAREGDVPEVPHRPVRRAPLFRRGSNKSLQGVTRLYMDEDGWEKSCREMDWVDAPPERHFPFYRTPTGRRCFFILHLFAGRRRLGDYHDELLRLASTEEFDVKVLSFDTAIHQQLGDLSVNSTIVGRISLFW